MDGFEVDPTRATSLDVGRRSFVGIAAAATAGIGSVARGLAQALPAMGQTHAPLVPEDDPSIVTDRPTLTVDGSTVASYAAWPKQADARTPSVVVVMHIWGVDTSIRDVVRRFADAGFAAIAPDLYARHNGPIGDGSADVAAFRPYAKQLDPKQYVDDLGAAAGWLAARFPSTKTAIMGFCMGGHIALVTAAATGKRFAAVCPFYGSPDGVDPHAIQIPVCGSYGARDTSIPAAAVRAFAAALTVPNDIRIYDEAGHAFFDDQRASYVATAAADAWKRTIAFLQKYSVEPACS
ncbi:MAG: dienelactone hydrolase family protein [Candidatus Tumulicola sp.]